MKKFMFSKSNIIKSISSTFHQAPKVLGARLTPSPFHLQPSTYCFVLFLFLLIPALLNAHKLNIFAYYENGKINIESFFSDGTPCKNCNVKILDNNKNLIFSGKLNEKGEITVNKKLTGNVLIKVNASMGHESSFNLKIGNDKKEKENSSNKIIKISEKNENLLPEIRKIVREELEKQLKPIILQLAKIEGNRTEKIVAGIGYILGIFGLLMLFKRKG